MESLSKKQKVKGRRKKLSRRENYFSCFGIIVIVACLVLLACVLGLLVVNVIEAIQSL